MIPLEMNRRVLTWICGYIPNRPESIWKKIGCIAFTLSIIAAHLLVVLAGLAFISKNMSIDLEATLFSVYNTVGCMGMVYQAIIIVIFSHKLTENFNGLSTIYIESNIQIVNLN